MTKRFLGYYYLSKINTLYISLNNIKEVVDDLNSKWPFDLEISVSLTLTEVSD
jgi:hypothetical protein